MQLSHQQWDLADEAKEKRLPVCVRTRTGRLAHCEPRAVRSTTATPVAAPGPAVWRPQLHWWEQKKEARPSYSAHEQSGLIVPPTCRSNPARQGGNAWLLQRGQVTGWSGEPEWR